MNRLRIALASLFVAFASPAFAVCGVGGGCFWVGGTGTWDNATTTHWASTSGGVGGVAVPSATDPVTFDGSSGGGTVTVAATINASNTINSLTLGAFTGTLDFSINNPNITITGVDGSGIGLDASGTGTRTFNMGNGTWTFTNNSQNLLNFFFTTGLTFNSNNSTIVVSNSSPANNRELQFGGLTFHAVTINTSGNNFARIILDAGTVGTLTINSINDVFFNSNMTISTALNVVGSASNSVVTLFTLDGGTKTLTLSGTASIAWAAIGGLIFTGSPTATNSFDLGGNSGITITGPSGGTNTGRCIGC